MRKNAMTVIFAALVLAVSGCASAPEPAPASESAPVTETTAPEPVAQLSADEQCAAYEGQPVTPEAGSEQLAAVIAAAPLPDGVVMNPGPQIITSTEKPGMFEAIVRICSAPLTDDDLREAANQIAMTIKGDQSSETLALLYVSAWEPGEDGELKEAGSVRAEYQMFTWDPAAARPMSKNWDQVR